MYRKSDTKENINHKQTTANTGITDCTKLVQYVCTCEEDIGYEKEVHKPHGWKKWLCGYILTSGLQHR
jgi:hypothetical protein